MRSLAGPACDPSASPPSEPLDRSPMEPTMRKDWISKRRAALGPGGNYSQMHLARKGIVTEEVQHVASRESLPPELIRAEVARGRMIIPANVNHPELEPMAVGIAAKCKVNANIGNSAVTSGTAEELEKLRVAVAY